MDLYQQNILDHYKNPRHVGKLKKATHSGGVVNPSCGDSLTVEFLVDKNGIIKEAGFVGEGCVLSQATASMLLEKVLNLSVEDAKKIDEKFLLDLLKISVGPNRLKCALMSLQALEQALKV